MQRRCGSAGALVRAAVRVYLLLRDACSVVFSSIADGGPPELKTGEPQADAADSQRVLDRKSHRARNDCCEIRVVLTVQDTVFRGCKNSNLVKMDEW